MNRYFDIEKAKATALYIVSRIDNADLLRVFKILYFAEKEHLAQWGSLILKDTYIAMKNGPVPSTLYDLFKGVRGDGYTVAGADGFYKAFAVTGKYQVKAKEKPDLDYLSEADVYALDKSIEENGKLSFDQLSEKSHDLAWKNANINDEIDYTDMAKAGGASPDMLKYIADDMVIDEILR